jgi:predicted DNA-binding antitoxin AbrB/MazE fold protein
MSESTMTVEAVYADGVFRPVDPLPLLQDERVTITIQRELLAGWPADTAEIYKEIEAEDRTLAESMWSGVKATLPIPQDR